jgi:hypothetical protein
VVLGRSSSSPYTYFVISDYLARALRLHLRHRGRNLALFFGSYTAKLIGRALHG